MADSRIFDLAERTTPEAGDFFMLDADGETDALKFDATKPLLKSAGDTQRITGPLYLDPGSDDVANVLRIPVTTDDGADFNFNLGGTTFEPTRDVTFNWGFNNSTGGPEVGTKHAWYLQLEYDYYTGQHYVEYHLNLFGANGDFFFRPFEYKYRIDGTGGSLTYRAASVSYSSIAGGETPHTALALTLAATNAASNVYVKAPFRVDIPSGNANAFYVVSLNNSVPVFQVDTNNNDLTFRGRIFTYLNADGSSALVKGTDNGWRFNGATYTGGMVNILQATNRRGLAISLAASTPGFFLQLLSNANASIAYIDQSGNYLFDGAGKIRALNGNLELQANSGYVQLTSVKTTTGDPTGAEGLIYWNTIDNAIKMYADGGWRTLVTW